MIACMYGPESKEFDEEFPLYGKLGYETLKINTNFKYYRLLF